MNGVDVVRSAFKAARWWYEGTVADVTHDQANYLAPGLVHPIGELMTHVLQSQDMVIHGMILGQPTVWESGDWAERLGIGNMASHTTEEARAFRVDPSILKPYAEAVYAASDAFFDTLSDDDLDREIDMSSWGMGPMSMGDLLTGITLGNTFAHTGEISALKGVQGAKGYPF